MRKMPPELIVEEEPPEITRIRASIGKQVPLRARYVRENKPILVGIDNDLCTLRFANGVVMVGVPIRDVVEDSGYWK